MSKIKTKSKAPQKTKKAATKTAKIVVTSSNISSKKKSAPTKQVKMSKSALYDYVSRTEMVQIINNSKGQFFTTTHIDKEGNPRTMNCQKSKSPSTSLGYITVYSMQDKGYRNIDPRTLTDLVFCGVHYKVRK